MLREVQRANSLPVTNPRTRLPPPQRHCGSSFRDESRAAAWLNSRAARPPAIFIASQKRRSAHMRHCRRLSAPFPPGQSVNIRIIASLTCARMCAVVAGERTGGHSHSRCGMCCVCCVRACVKFHTPSSVRVWVCAFGTRTHREIDHISPARRARPIHQGPGPHQSS